MSNRSILLFQLLILLGFFLGWQVLPEFGFVNNRIVPPLSSVLQSGLQAVSTPTAVPQGFVHNLEVYLFEIAISYLLVVSVGVSLGVVLGVYQMLGDLIEPVVLAIFSIPHLIFYPLLLLLFGFGSSSKIAYGLLAGTLITIVTVLAYIRQLDPNYAKVARVMGASFFGLVRHVIVPALIPGFESALQLGLAFTIIGVTVAEILGSSEGVGFLINWATYLFRSDLVLFLVGLVIIIGIAINLLYDVVLRILTRH